MTDVDRTPQPCSHTRVRHQHGRRETYEADRCRCDDCRAANATYARRRRKLSTWQRTPGGMVDAAPVRAHVLRLQAAGLGRRQIRLRTGISGAVLHCLVNGRHGKPPTVRVAAKTARRLLALPVPTIDELADGAIIDGVGTQRRLQALVARGWTQGALAARIGWSKENLSRVIHGYGAAKVTVATRRAVVDLYEELWSTTPADTRGAGRSRKLALKNGWAPPLAWEEDTIDDPTATPEVGDSEDVVDDLAVDAVCEGISMPLSGATLLAALDRLTDTGHPITVIAERLRITERQVHRLRGRDTVTPRYRQRGVA